MSLSNVPNGGQLQGGKEEGAGVAGTCLSLPGLAGGLLCVPLSHTGARRLVFRNLPPASLGITHATPVTLAGVHPSVCSPMTPCTACKHCTRHLHAEVSSALQVPCLDRIFCPVDRTQVAGVTHSLPFDLTSSELPPLARLAGQMRHLYMMSLLSLSVVTRQGILHPKHQETNTWSLRSLARSFQAFLPSFHLQRSISLVLLLQPSLEGGHCHVPC